MWRVILTFAGIALFVGLLVWGGRAQQRVECEVCVAFNGRIECRTARGGSEELAVQGAVSTACALLGRGVTDAIQCNATPPLSTRCRER